MAFTISARVTKQSFLKHFLCIGGSGSGKTTLQMQMFYDMIRTSNSSDFPESLIMLEPHGDASLRAGLIRIIPRDRLVFMSNAINRLAQNSTGENYTFTFNPFEHDGSEEMKYHLTHELTNAFTELLESSMHTTQMGLSVQMATMLSHAIAVVMESEEPSILTLLRMFTPDNEDLLTLGQTFKHPLVQQFFQYHFMSDSYKQTRSSIYTKLSYFVSDAQVYQILGTKHSTLKLDEFIDAGKVIIIHTPQGISTNVQSFIGRLILARAFSCVLKREAIPVSKRRNVFVFVDEFQQYTTKSISHILQSARKYNMGLCLFTQSLKQISDTKLISSIQTNTNWKAVGVIDVANREAMAKEIGCTAERIANLVPLQFLIKQAGNNDFFQFTTLPLDDDLFYTEAEALQLYRYLMKDSGQYIPIKPFTASPPPPAPPRSERAIKETRTGEKRVKKQNDDDPFSEGIKPAF